MSGKTAEGVHRPGACHAVVFSRCSARRIYEDTHLFAYFVLCSVLYDMLTLFFTLPEPLLRVNIVIRIEHIVRKHRNIHGVWIYGGF